MRNHKVTLFLERNKVTWDIYIRVTLYLKGEKITLVVDIKVTQLIKENRVTLIILDMKVISNLELFKFWYLKKQDQPI